MLRFLTAGESHGPALSVVLEGIPAGLPITAEDLANELARRRLGYGRGPRQRFEKDELEILGGVRHGKTLGSPIAVVIRNTEWPKWEKEMSVEPGVTEKPLHQPRPGYPDLAGMQKYGFDEARNVLERASARETAARVAAGSIAKQLLAQLGMQFLSHTVQVGNARASAMLRPEFSDLERIDESKVRCFDAEAEPQMIEQVKAAAKEGDSLGGVAEIIGFGIPPGLGSYVHWDRKIDGLLAQALMSIHSVKAVEIGEGVENAGRRGSQAHDEIFWDEPTNSYVRGSDRAGGIEGGVTNGALLILRAFMKPLSTLNRPVLHTVDVTTKEETVSFKERTDVMVVPAGGVIAESMVALVLANEALRKFGGDSVAEFVRNFHGYMDALK